ncbi:MAG TPA: hypothetical protein EYH28_01950 [Anaerolineaceae bacterium]|nr:hypothetical protein [Anaerolineaceae bacterium]
MRISSPVGLCPLHPFGPYSEVALCLRQKLPKHLVIGLWLLIWGASAVYALVAQARRAGGSGADADLDGLARALVPLAVWALIGVSTATTGLTHLFARQAAPYQERPVGLGPVLFSLYAVSRIWRLLRQG